MSYPNSQTAALLLLDEELPPPAAKPLPSSLVFRSSMKLSKMQSHQSHSQRSRSLIDNHSSAASASNTFRRNVIPTLSHSKVT